MPVLDGFRGTLQIGPAGSETTMQYVTAWSADIKRDTKSTGPYITPSSDGSVGTSLGALTCTGSLSIDMQTGGDPARAALTTALMSGTRPRLVLAETGGQTLTVPAAVISGVKKEVKSDDTATFSVDFVNDGAFTLV